MSRRNCYCCTCKTISDQDFSDDRDGDEAIDVTHHVTNAGFKSLNIAHSVDDTFGSDRSFSDFFVVLDEGKPNSKKLIIDADAGQAASEVVIMRGKRDGLLIYEWEFIWPIGQATPGIQTNYTVDPPLDYLPDTETFVHLGDSNDFWVGYLTTEGSGGADKLLWVNGTTITFVYWWRDGGSGSPQFSVWQGTLNSTTDLDMIVREMVPADGTNDTITLTLVDSSWIDWLIDPDIDEWEMTISDWSIRVKSGAWWRFYDEAVYAPTTGVTPKIRCRCDISADVILRAAEFIIVHVAAKQNGKLFYLPAFNLYTALTTSSPLKWKTYGTSLFGESEITWPTTGWQVFDSSTKVENIYKHPGHFRSESPDMSTGAGDITMGICVVRSFHDQFHDYDRSSPADPIENEIVFVDNLCLSVSDPE